MVKLIIVRHGFSLFNGAKVFSGQYDVPLSRLGYEQAKSSAEYIKRHYKVDAVYASDLSRTVDTAKPIAEAFGLGIIKDARLRERSLGTWEGVSHAEIRESDPEGFRCFKEDFAHCNGGGGESFLEVGERLTEAFDEIVRDNDGKTVAVVTHAGLIRTMCAVWQGRAADDIADIRGVSNASVTVVECEGSERRFLEIGMDRHLFTLNNKYKVITKSDY